MTAEVLEKPNSGVSYVHNAVSPDCLPAGRFVFRELSALTLVHMSGRITDNTICLSEGMTLYSLRQTATNVINNPNVATEGDIRQALGHAPGSHTYEATTICADLE